MRLVARGATRLVSSGRARQKSRLRVVTSRAGFDVLNALVRIVTRGAGRVTVGPLALVAARAEGRRTSRFVGLVAVFAVVMDVRVPRREHQRLFSVTIPAALDRGNKGVRLMALRTPCVLGRQHAMLEFVLVAMSTGSDEGAARTMGLVAGGAGEAVGHLGLVELGRDLSVA